MSEWLSVCVAISLLLSLVTAAAYMLYSGLIEHINILTGSPPIKKITFAYKFRQGPYRTGGPLFKESHNIGPKLPCIGVFYDDPNEVKHFTKLLHSVPKRMLLTCLPTRWRCFSFKNELVQVALFVNSRLKYNRPPTTASFYMSKVVDDITCNRCRSFRYVPVLRLFLLLYYPN